MNMKFNRAGLKRLIYSLVQFESCCSSVFGLWNILTEMLSPFSLKALTTCIKFWCYVKACPFEWDEKKFRLGVSQKKRTWVLFTITTLFSFFSFGFGFFRSLMTVISEGIEPMSVLQLNVICFSAFCAIAPVNTACRMQVGCDLINHLLQNEKQLTGIRF